MVEFLDCPDELLVFIVSNISKPSHILQLALVKKRIHPIAIQHLYENLTFDKDSYPPTYPPRPEASSRTTWTLIRCPSNAGPQPNILRLSNMIRSNAIPQGQKTIHLTIIMGINHIDNLFQTSLSLLLPHMSSLKTLTLKSVSEDRLAWQREHFSFRALAAALTSMSQTLESLDMDFSLDPKDCDAWTIGTLRHFSKLRYLSVQGNVLLGHFNYPLPCLDSILPQGLQRLRLHWCEIQRIAGLILVLIRFLDNSVEVSHSIKEIVVQLNDRAANRVDLKAVQRLEGHLSSMNEKAEKEGLDLEFSLEWREDPRLMGCQPWVDPNSDQHFMAALLRLCPDHLDWSDDCLPSRSGSCLVGDGAK